MSNNKFIDKVLYKLSLVNPRLQCSLTRLYIQIELQYDFLQLIIQYFLTLQPKYQDYWNQHNLRNQIQCYYLTNIPEFIQLKEHMTGQKILSHDEADWLEDAIHETLLDDD
jgi:hypothetical protein